MAGLLVVTGTNLAAAGAEAPKLWTTFDGVTSDKYISYMQLDGTSGATVPLADTPSLN